MPALFSSSLISCCNLASHRLDGFRPPGSWIACTWRSELAGWACVLEGNPASSPSPQWPVTFLKAVEGSVSEDLNQLSNNSFFFFATKVLKAPDCYQLEHFEDQTVYLFFLVTNQIRELRAVAVIG